jgi:hypothetical protein
LCCFLPIINSHISSILGHTVHPSQLRPTSSSSPI